METRFLGATQATYTASATGNYHLFVTDANACEGTSLPYSLIVNPLPIVNITGDATLCSGETSVLTATSTNVSAYQWFNQNGTTAIPNSNSPSLSVTLADSYSVQVLDINGCQASSPIFTVTFVVSPIATIFPTDSIVDLCLRAGKLLHYSKRWKYLFLVQKQSNHTRSK